MFHLLWPTIRPDIFSITVQDWLKKATNSSRIKVVPIVNSQDHAKTLNNVIVTNPSEPGVTKALYSVTQNYEANDKDIIIVASDDFFPPSNWDSILLEEFSNFDGLLVFFDGIQDSSSLVTIPILTFSALKKMNRIIYHPSYKHLWADVECYCNANELGILKDLRREKRHIIFEHRHYSIGKRSSDQVDAYANRFESTDRINYNKRIQLSLTERLKV